MERKFKKTAGKKLHLLRIEKHLTQEDMAEKLHLSTSAYCKIEYGETDLTLTRLNRIAQIFELSPFDLFKIIYWNTSSEKKTDFPELLSSNNFVNEELQNLLKSHTLLLDAMDKRIAELEKKIQG